MTNPGLKYFTKTTDQKLMIEGKKETVEMFHVVSIVQAEDGSEKERTLHKYYDRGDAERRLQHLEGKLASRNRRKGKKPARPGKLKENKPGFTDFGNYW